MKKFFNGFEKFMIGIKLVNGKRMCIRGWYMDYRVPKDSIPKGYYSYDFRSTDYDGDDWDDDNYEENDWDSFDYYAYIEPFVLVNHSGTFICKQEIPFGVDGNPMFFKTQYVRNW